jgi:ketosteroid isomerase-like protein
MSADQNMHLARKLLTQMAQGEAPDVIAALFSNDVRFEIAGDVGALPWIGHRRGRSAVSDFFRDVRALTELVRFDVEGILADEAHAVVIGDLASKLQVTGTIVETAFALILTIQGKEITRFQMLEDSFAVSRTARSADRAGIRVESPS